MINKEEISVCKKCTLPCSIHVDCPLVQTWHTGTPTEEGWYVLLTSETIPYSVAYWQNEWLGKEWTIRDSIVVAWMPITPFEASKEK